MSKSISIFGSTGSIGKSTLELIDAHPEDFHVQALVAGSDVEGLAAQARKFAPKMVGIADESRLGALREALGGASGGASGSRGAGIEIVCGESACAQIAEEPVDLVVAGIVGLAGLPSVMTAVRSGQIIALANKESLVSAGEVVTRAAHKGAARIIPVDSEHSALFQCIEGSRGHLPPFPSRPCEVSHVCITASGGPFRERDMATFADITPDEAVRHPRWSMGRKISVDSATMMNKGLEVIEAAWLFALSGDDIKVLVHPQVAVHALVYFMDGSVVGHLSNPDMKTPISLALAWPNRLDWLPPPIDLARIGRLDFMEVEAARYPCYALAREALKAGGGAPAVLNAANEIAVAAFLEGRIGFVEISGIVDHCLEHTAPGDVSSLEGVMELDGRARQAAQERIGRG